MMMLPRVTLAPQHLGGGEARRAAADDDDARGASAAASGRAASAGSRLSLRTKMRPPRCSTFQHATGLSAGARSASPVRRSKQA